MTADKPLLVGTALALADSTGESDENSFLRTFWTVLCAQKFAASPGSRLGASYPDDPAACDSGLLAYAERPVPEPALEYAYLFRDDDALGLVVVLAPNVDNVDLATAWGALVASWNLLSRPARPGRAATESGEVSPVRQSEPASTRQT